MGGWGDLGDQERVRAAHDQRHHPHLREGRSLVIEIISRHPRIAEFDGVTLKAFFTPAEIAGVDESVFREKDRLGHRAKYIGRFAEFFTDHDPDEVDHGSKAELMTEFQTIKGVGPYTAAIIAGSAVRDPSALGLDV